MNKMITRALIATCMTVLSACVIAEGPGVYELRTYTANEGKMENLQARFRNHTLGLFEKHGMKNVGYWLPSGEPNTLVYLIRHDNVSTVKASWEAFVADPEWQKVYADSIKDGRLVADIESVFMTATDYSPMQ